MELWQRLLQADLSAADWQHLETQTLADRRRADAFGITPTNVTDSLRARSTLLRLVYPQVAQFCQQRFAVSPSLWQTTLWQFWLPLALWLAAQRQASNRPLVLGVLGGQGSGKTTLGRVLSLILQALQYRTLSLSLDDLYKTYADRQQLRAADPRLLWRGPPGTHDVDLGIQVLDQLRHPHPDQPIALPRFDKSLHQGSGDRTSPELVEAADIILFEGWFVGTRPVPDGCFDQAPAPIFTPADRCFARDMNRALAAYQPLWQRCDRLLVLHPIEYRWSLRWRQQAEREMVAGGKPGMSDREIERFVEYFWKALHPELFIHPLVHRTDGADLVVDLDIDHIPQAIYRSGC